MWGENCFWGAKPLLWGGGKAAAGGGRKEPQGEKLLVFAWGEILVLEEKMPTLGCKLPALGGSSILGCKMAWGAHLLFRGCEPHAGGGGGHAGWLPGVLGCP